MTSSDDSFEPDKKRLLTATAVAFVVAMLVLMAFVLPAEYGVDPLGTGQLLGLGGLGGPPIETAQTTPTILNETSLKILRFHVSHSMADALVLEIDGDAGIGEPIDVPVNAKGPNLVHLHASLTWTDAHPTGIPAPDTFEIQWFAPDGTVHPPNQARDRDGAGKVETIAFIGTPPETRPIEATDPSAALDEMRSTYPDSERGVGEWSLRVTLLEAPGPAGLPDGENTWNLVVYQRTYISALEPPTETGRTQQVFTLDLPAHSAIEFKLHLDAGATIGYSWDSPSPLYYDFHGDRDDEATFETHETGTSTERESDFTAPFTGRHGWYWRNDNTIDTTITLGLTGEYRIIGHV